MLLIFRFKLGRNLLIYKIDGSKSIINLKFNCFLIKLYSIIYDLKLWINLNLKCLILKFLFKVNIYLLIFSNLFLCTIIS